MKTKLFIIIIIIIPAFIGFNVNAQTAYITNYLGNTVSVVNVATNTVTSTIPVGSQPKGVSVSPDGSKVYVTNYEDSTVSVINTFTNTVTATIPVGRQPMGISVSPDGSTVYVANYEDNTVSVINTATNTVTATIPVGRQPMGISVSPDGSKVYVTCTEDNVVNVINTATNTVSATIPDGLGPQGISVTPDGSKVYVASGGDSVSVINTFTNTVTSRIYVGHGQNPCCITVTPDGSMVYVTNYMGKTVSVINTATNTVTATITVGSGPIGGSVSPDGSKLYVANSGDNTVSVINTSVDTVSATITGFNGAVAFGNFISKYYTSTGDTTATACNSFTWNDSTYTSTPAIAPTEVLVNKAGFDSTVTLHLTINYSTTGDTTATACNSLTWYGTTYYTSGTPTHNLTNVSGCDSTVTLTLTINHSTMSSTTLAACDSLHWNGTTYTTSGTKTFITTNSKGCDSTATLYLTINHSTTSSTTMAACDSLHWNGTTYTTSGTKTFITTNSQGCDSTATLHLTINNSTVGDTSVITCNSFTWNDSTYSVTPAIAPTKILTNKAGCDSTVTLNLTINSNMIDTTAVVCNSFKWYDSTYTKTPSIAPTKIFTNKAGCDSTITLHLTINHPPKKPVATVTAQPSCADSTGTITVTSPINSGITYSIDSLTYTNTTGLFSNVAPGKYYVNEDSAGCISSPSNLLTVNAYTVTLAVTYPYNGVTLYKGLNDTIKWNTNCTSRIVNINLYEGKTKVAQLASNIANTGSLPYNPPVSLTNATNYRISISDNDNAVTDTSAYFKIESTYAAIQFSGAAINGFGFVPVNDTVKETLTITNIGNLALNISNITYPSDSDAIFKGNYTSGTINPGASQNIIVSCQPEKHFPYSGWIVVTSNSVNKEDSVVMTVSGSGVGIEEMSSKNIFRLFPNPATTSITLVSQLQGQAVVEISDLQGQLIETLATNGNKTNVDISSLPCGMYFIRMKTEQGRMAVDKFIKE
jgi:YVTN family beta-propeller protein